MRPFCVKGLRNSNKAACREGDRHILLRDHRDVGARRKMSQSPAVLLESLSSPNPCR
jgi:hypothetical protein